MKKYKTGTLRKTVYIAAVLLWMLLLVSPSTVHTVQAGSGPTIDIPSSTLSPTMDGVCDLTEYSDAAIEQITVGTSQTFPIYMKHTATDAYFCFGDNISGIPLPNGTGNAASVTVYIDRANDGATSGSNADDFGVWMAYDPAAAPFSHYWGTTTYDGADPGGWSAVKHQISGTSPFWQVEFRISSQTLGGWNHKVGLAFFYHWWRFTSDDYSWPANGIWANPQLWANANLPITGSVNIDFSSTIPALDGQCSPEYADASKISFDAPGGAVTGYLKHTATDLYICLTNLTIPAADQQDSPNAALYIDRAGTGGGAPGADDLLFTISYHGAVQANSGDGAGFNGPDPGGYSAAMFHASGTWDAEFRISRATLGHWVSQVINLSAVEQNVNAPGDSFGWPAGYSTLVPNTWGVALLTGPGSQIYLPLTTR